MPTHNLISQEQYNLYCSLKEHIITFNKNEIYIFKLGEIPDEKFEYLLKGTDKIQINRVIFLLESAMPYLPKSNDFFNVINPNTISHWLRFNKNHSYQHKPLSYQEAIFTIEGLLKQYYYLIQSIKDDPKSKKSIEIYRKRIDDLNSMIINLKFHGASSKVYLSNYFRAISYDYVYVMHITEEGKKTNTKSHLKKNIPNIILVNNNYKQTFVKRNAIIGNFTKQLFIPLDEFSPYDIFLDFNYDKSSNNT